MLPLIVREPETPAARRALEEDSEMAAWWSTPVECWSALARLRRELVTLNERLAVAAELEGFRVLALPV